MFFHESLLACFEVFATIGLGTDVGLEVETVAEVEVEVDDSFLFFEANLAAPGCDNFAISFLFLVLELLGKLLHLCWRRAAFENFCWLQKSEQSSEVSPWTLGGGIIEQRWATASG